MILLILISQLTALHLRYVTLYLLLLFLGRHNYLNNRWAFSPNLPERWQMGCIRKLKLLDSEFFRGLEEDTKVSLFSGPSWTQLHEIEHGDRKDLPVEKRNLAVWSWRDTFFYQTRETARKCVLWCVYSPGHYLTENGWVCFFRQVALLYNTALMKTSLTAMILI